MFKQYGLARLPSTKMNDYHKSLELLHGEAECHCNANAYQDVCYQPTVNPVHTQPVQYDIRLSRNSFII